MNGPQVSINSNTGGGGSTEDEYKK